VRGRHSPQGQTCSQEQRPPTGRSSSFDFFPACLNDTPIRPTPGQWVDRLRWWPPVKRKGRSTRKTQKKNEKPWGGKGGGITINCCKLPTIPRLPETPRLHVVHGCDRPNRVVRAGVQKGGFLVGKKRKRKTQKEKGGHTERGTTKKQTRLGKKGKVWNEGPKKKQKGKRQLKYPLHSPLNEKVGSTPGHENLEDGRLLLGYVQITRADVAVFSRCPAPGVFTPPHTKGTENKGKEPVQMHKIFVVERGSFKGQASLRNQSGGTLKGTAKIHRSFCWLRVN